MQTNRIIFWIAFFFVCLFFTSTPVAATTPDFSIICQNQSICKQLGTQNVPIFSEQNIVPGQSFTRVVQVKNENKLHACQLHLRLTETVGAQENVLADKLLVQVFHNGALLLGSPVVNNTSLNILQLQTETFARYFWSLPPKAIEKFDLAITFDPQADNQYQGTNAQTDIAIAITCLQEDELSPISETAVVLPNPTQEIVEVPLEGCSINISQERPNLVLTRIDENRGLVSFSWSPITGASEYWLEFGSEENSEQFRHRGITATNYTILAVDMQNDLFYRVLPVADCARGQYSNSVEVSGKQDKKPIASELVEEPQVLGSQEREVNDAVQESAGMINQPSSQDFTPLPLVIVLLFFFWMLILRKK